MDFIVDFNKWVFSDKNFHEDRGITFLENEYGNMCCLGFCTKQILPEIQMTEIPSPRTLIGTFNLELSTYAQIMHVDLTAHAMNINDKVTIPWRQKILFLQLLFSIFDHTITFINVPKE